MANLKLDLIEMEKLHHLAFGTYEAGKLALEEYKSWVVINKQRPFTPAQFQRFAYAIETLPRDD